MTNNRRKYLKVRAWRRLLENSGSAPRSASAIEFSTRLLRDERGISPTDAAAQGSTPIAGSERGEVFASVKGS
jgi:hypothetical protein